MKQERFEALYSGQWQIFEEWLSYQKKSAQTRRKTPPPFPDSEFPERYRAMCRLLALAQDRHFSLSLINHLQNLVQEGHDLFYKAPSGFLNNIIQYVTSGFAQDVRQNWRYMLASALCFFGTFFITLLAVRIWPDFTYVILPYEEIFKMREMYSDPQASTGFGAADSRVQMFGFYVLNNTSIGFRCFAGGITGGLLTLSALSFNGVFMGAVEADLWNAGLGRNFYAFVSGHTAFELTAIVLCGGAGLKLGWALIAPGRRKRGESLRYAAKSVIGIVAGSAVLFFAAALVEAFWSPISVDIIPFPLKVAVGIFLCILTLAYFILAGRRQHAD